MIVLLFLMPNTPLLLKGESSLPLLPRRQLLANAAIAASRVAV
jgi:hypothetical protein